MSVVDLHPEQLFDALRAGKLSAGERARLEAHCARCTACMFELRWVDAAPLSQLPDAEDCAYGDVAFDNVLRGLRPARVSNAKPRSFSWKMPLAKAGLMLAVGASIGWFITRPSDAEQQRSVPAVTTFPSQFVEAASPPAPQVTQPPAEPEHDAQHAVAEARPSANQLLAAARRAQSRGEVEHAERLYSQVISEYVATPAGGAAQIALGRLLFEQQPFAAVVLFDGYLRRRPSGTLAEEALFYRALSLEKLGEAQTAAASWRELLRKFPKSLYTETARAHLATSKSVE